MRKGTALFVVSFLAVLGCMVASWGKPLGCGCETPTVCQAYSRAEAIFVGKLISFEIDDKSFIRTVTAHFDVEKVFKGNIGKQEFVRFKMSDCFHVELKPGEKYFVYKDTAESMESVCNRTNLIANSVAELNYVNNISTTEPTYNVSGFLYGLSKDELHQAKITIEAGKLRQEVAIGEDGLFNFSTKNASEFVVRIALPFDAIVYMKDLDLTFPASGKEIVYCVKVRPNECNYREIGISKKGERPDTDSP